MKASGAGCEGGEDWAGGAGAVLRGWGGGTGGCMLDGPEEGKKEKITWWIVTSIVKVQGP